MRAGLAAHRDLETEQQRAYYLVLMADALCAAGRIDDGLQVLDQAAAAVNASDEHFCEAELYRIRGELLARAERRDEAQTYIQRAIGVAQSQCAKALELRGVTSLARLSAGAGQRDLARAMLASIFDWFTEGFDTHDLRAARSLLADLS